MALGSYGATDLVARRLTVLETSEEGSTNASAGCVIAHGGAAAQIPMN